MKKSVMFLILVIAALVMSFTGAVYAADSHYNVEMSTDPITDADLTPDIEGNAKIASIVLSNGTAAATTATLYTLGGSTPTITAIMGPIQIPANSNFTKDFERGEELTVEDFVIRASTGDQNAFIKYR